MEAGTSRHTGRVLAGMLLLLGCGTPRLAVLDDGFRHRQHGYSFAAPGSEWKRTKVKQAVIAYRRPGMATMSLQSRCGGPVADPATLARHLRIGLRPYTLRQAGPTSVSGARAWSQVFDASRSEAVVRIKTVTLVDETCVLDWVLVAHGDFDSIEPEFDAWVGSVQLPGHPVSGGGAP